MNSNRSRIDELTHLLLRVGTKFSQLDKKTVDLGTGEKLYPTELHTIEAIGNKNGQSVTALCEFFDVTKGAVSQIISRLEKKGYVVKRRNQESAREIIITLTQKGEFIFKHHMSLHNQMDKEISAELQNYSEREMELLRNFLLMAEHHIQKYIEI